MGEIGDLEFGIHKKFKKCIFLPIERAGTNKFFGKSCSVGRGKKVDKQHIVHCGATSLMAFFSSFIFFPCNLLDLKQRHE